MQKETGKSDREEIKDCLKKLEQYIENAEQNDFEELAKYILRIEKQLETISENFGQLKNIVNTLQTPVVKKSFKDSLDNIEYRIVYMKTKVDNVKREMLCLLKEELQALKSNTIIKTINTFSLKDNLQQLQKTLNGAKKGVQSLTKKIDQATKEMRSAKASIRNVFRIMTGKESIKADYKRLNTLQKVLNGLYGQFDNIEKKTGRATKQLGVIQNKTIKKPSVKRNCSVQKKKRYRQRSSLRKKKSKDKALSMRFCKEKNLF